MKKKLGRLYNFFSEIDDLLMSISPEDVQFKASHSKQACIRILADTKKENMEAVISYYEKSLGRDLPMWGQSFRDCWRAATQYLLERYKHIEQLANDCYALSVQFGIQSLEFAIEDVANRGVQAYNQRKI